MVSSSLKGEYSGSSFFLLILRKTFRVAVVANGRILLVKLLSDGGSFGVNLVVE